MAKNASAESEHHIVGVRLRITGTGSLQHQVAGLDNIVQDTLLSVTMTTTNRLEPTVIANLQSQRIRYELFTNTTGTQFTIRRIIMFVKPVAVEYPAGGL